MIRKGPKTPVYKFEVYIVDFDHLGADEVQSILENAEDMIGTTVVHLGTKKVEWHDDIDLNQIDQCEEAFQKLFE